MSKTDQQVEIRKLRKKLRQIENLETLNRDLTDDEASKVEKKDSVRSVLRSLLQQCPPDEEEEQDTSHYDTSLDQSHYTTDDVNESHDSEEPVSFISAEDDDYDMEAERQEPDGGYEFTPVTLETNRPSPMSDEQSNVETTKQTSASKREPSQGDGTKTAGESPTKKPKASAPVVEKVDPRKRVKDLQRYWRQSAFSVREFEGHSDLVTCVCLEGDILISGSRDTTVKVWDIKTGIEVRSLGGHTESVTQVILLNQSESSKVGKAYNIKAGDQLVISTSLDCSISCWSLNTGELLKSMYTYNPITAATYLYKESLVVIGSSGGKVELWDIEAANCVQSLRTHEDAVTGLTIGVDQFCSCSSDGIVKVFRVRERTLSVLFESEDVKTRSGEKYIPRPMRCLAMHRNRIYYGDDGTNLKVIDWQAGTVHKLPNHNSEFGTTDAVGVSDSLIFTSGYDLDNGLAYLNVRVLPDERYMCTVSDDDTTRILCLCVSGGQGQPMTSQKGRGLRVITGGCELKMWTFLENSTNQKPDESNVHFIGRFDKAARHSDIESGSEMSDDHNLQQGDSDTDDDDAEKPSDTNEDDKSWFSWCNIL